MPQAARSLPLIAVALLAAVPHELGAQTSELYLTGAGGGIAVLQGGVVTRQWSQPSVNAYGIAIGTTVRTIGGLVTRPGQASGFEYLLDGTATGTTYGPAGPPPSTIYDATSDGQRNYFLHWDSQRVYQAGLDWSSPTELFRVSTTQGSHSGISYDANSQSLWVGAWEWTAGAGGVVKRYSLAGQLLGSFSTRAGGPLSVTGLAYDRADNTLWMSDFVRTPNTLFQYAVDGTLLQTVTFQRQGLGPMRILGGEFGAPPPTISPLAAPEPASMTLLAAGLAAIGTVAWRRRRPA